MDINVKNMQILAESMNKLKSVCGFNNSLVITEFGDVALVIEYKYENYDRLTWAFDYYVKSKFNKFVVSYAHEWVDYEYNLRDTDICRMVIKLKF